MLRMNNSEQREYFSGLMDGLCNAHQPMISFTRESGGLL